MVWSFPQAHVLARVELGAALAHDDVAGRYPFPAKVLHAQGIGDWNRARCDWSRRPFYEPWDPPPTLTSVMRTSVYFCRCPVFRW